MVKAEIKERLFRWIAVPALAAVLAILALLQYRWSGQVSTATKAQMQSNLQTSLLGFRQDVARELASACLEIKPALDASPVVSPSQMKEQFSHWQQTSPHPNLVQHIYIWEDPGHQQPLRFDPVRGEFVRAAWPSEFAPLEQHLEMISAMAALHSARAPDAPVDGARRPRFPDRGHFPHNGHMRHGGTPRNRPDSFVPPLVIDQSVPALIYLARRRPEEPQAKRAMMWLVIQLNKSVLEKEIFPELAQKYFRGESGLDYHVAVRESENAGEHVIYASDPGFGADDSIQVDAVLNLFGPPFGRGGGPPMGPEFFFAPLHPSGVDHPGPPEERRMQGPDRTPRIEVLRHSADQSVWQVVARHKSGSVEVAVNGLRRRNLMASFGVLIVLGVTMALIFIASQRARRLAKLQMDFVTGVSHELRTPLAVISSAAENIAHGVVEDKQQLVRYGNSIVKHARQLTQLVEQVLQFAATQQAPRSYGHGPVDLADVVDAALESTAATVAAAGFTVEREIDPGLPPVSADFGGLVQSLQNLITNAVKYGGERRWLRIAARGIQEKGQTREVVLSVEDQGIGISKEELKHVFEPFYRSPAVTEAGIHGTGLGLPLARKIVEAMGGHLTAESEPGKGSAFTIHLQAAEARGLAERAAEKPAGAEPDFSA
jgi:signal transduction histidine kinase